METAAPARLLFRAHPIPASSGQFRAAPSAAALDGKHVLHSSGPPRGQSQPMPGCCGETQARALASALDDVEGSCRGLHRPWLPPAWSCLSPFPEGVHISEESCSINQASLMAQWVKNLPAMQETPVQFLGQEDPLEKGEATHSSILGLPLWLSW